MERDRSDGGPARRCPLKWQLRKRGRRLRRDLGLPILRRRTWLLVFLAFLGLIYLGATVVADFVMKIGEYTAPRYEPRDFSREPKDFSREKTR